MLLDVELLLLDPSTGLHDGGLCQANHFALVQKFPLNLLFCAAQEYTRTVVLAVDMGTSGQHATTGVKHTWCKYFFYTMRYLPLMACSYLLLVLSHLVRPLWSSCTSFSYSSQRAVRKSWIFCNTRSSYSTNSSLSCIHQIPVNWEHLIVPCLLENTSLSMYPFARGLVQTEHHIKE